MLPMEQALLVSELIGLIYEAAGDVSTWPHLLDRMSRYLDQSALPGDPERTIARWVEEGGVPGETLPEHSLFASLASHFVRAHELHRQLAEADREIDLLEGVMNRLPLGMALIDDQRRSISLNRAMLSLVRGGGPLRLEAGRLVSQPLSALADAIVRVSQPDGGDVVLRLDDGRTKLSLWVSRVPSGGGARGQEERILVLAASQTARALSESGLRTLFGLTEAEARMTQQLALGRTIEEYSAAQGISANTAKTHLKRIFSKVGVRRQAELLQAVYASPLWLDTGRGVDGLPADAVDLLPADGARAMLKLPDGRLMAYADCGDPRGLPVIYMHGIAGSCDLRHPDDTLLLSHGVRLVIPERPGSGDSEPRADRRILDWPADVAALADHLGIGRFVALGYSAGTAYALATAWALPARVIAVEIVAAVPPLGGLDDLRDYALTSRTTLAVARLAPSLLPPMMRVAVRGIRRNPYRYFEMSLAGATASDRRMFDDPRLRGAYVKALLASVRRGEQELAQEIRLGSHDWGFDPSEVRCPVRLWHGATDPLVALHGAQKLAGSLPGSRLKIVPDAGHYIIYSHWEDILRACREAASVEDGQNR